jgi:excisionase family DNA binding protein
MKLDLDDLISQAEAARIRGVGHEAIRHLIKKGRLKTVTIGGKTFLSRKEVQSYKPSPGGRPRKKNGGKKRKRISNAV